MEKITDWNALWRDLVAIKAESRKDNAEKEENVDAWCKKAAAFKEGVKRRWKTPDSSRDLILSRMKPDSSFLDIGAGTGAWSGLIAPHVRQVTAVEPSPSMIGVMRESLAEEGITNVEVIQGAWPDIPVEQHDYSLCSHAMYGYPDLPEFIRRMEECTRDTCFLLLRAPSQNSIRSEAARHIWGQPLDSPNFTIAFNILLEMDIYPHVQMENTGLWKSRTSSSLEDALAGMKRFLCLNTSEEYDDYLYALLKRRLSFENGRYIWPPEVRSALVFWQPEK